MGSPQQVIEQHRAEVRRRDAGGGRVHNERFCSCGVELPWSDWEDAHKVHLIAVALEKQSGAEAALGAVLDHCAKATPLPPMQIRLVDGADIERIADEHGQKLAKPSIGTPDVEQVALRIERRLAPHWVERHEVLEQVAGEVARQIDDLYRAAKDRAHS